LILALDDKLIEMCVPHRDGGISVSRSEGNVLLESWQKMLQEIWVKITCRTRSDQLVTKVTYQTRSDELVTKVTYQTRSDELVTKDITPHVHGKEILVVIFYSCNWSIKILEMGDLFCIIDPIASKMGSFGEQNVTNHMGRGG
jgi:hypothetical protein